MTESNLKWFLTLVFKPGTMLDVGSYNVNGALKSIIPVTLGVDMRDGPGVNRVCDASKLEETFGVESFDNVVSANTLEHCKDWKEMLRNMHSVCRTGGVIAICTCGKNKGRHGYPEDFWRFTVDELEMAFAGNEVVSRYDDANKWVGIAVRKTAEFQPIEFEVSGVPAKGGK